MRRQSRSNWLVPALAVAGGVVLLRYALRRPPYSFTDKVVVITGGARGLGLVIARKSLRTTCCCTRIKRNEL